MFDFAWSEIALIGIVALIAIGPKDMPVAIKAVTGAIKKARRMAAEFQTHVEDLVKEADLSDIKSSINEIRNFDFKGTVERAVDPDGSLRTTIASHPLRPDPTIYNPAPEEPATSSTVAELERPEAEVVTPAPEPHGDEPPIGGGATQAALGDDAGHEAPAFIPPAYAARPEPPPDFVPPNVTRRPPGRA